MVDKREDIDDFEVWWKYEQEGWTLQEIADYYGCGHSTIWYRLHPEKLKDHYKRNKESVKRYQQSEKGKASIRRHQQSDKFKEVMKRHMQSEKGKATMKRANQSEKGKARMRKHRQSEKGKETNKRSAFKHRQLGFIPLNEPFNDSEFHHYDKEHGIHIPYEIHHSIFHNVWTSEGMEAINKEAFEFLEYELREEAWSKITGDWIIR